MLIILQVVALTHRERYIDFVLERGGRDGRLPWADRREDSAVNGAVIEEIGGAHHNAMLRTQSYSGIFVPAEKPAQVGSVRAYLV